MQTTRIFSTICIALISLLFISCNRKKQTNSTEAQSILFEVFTKFERVEDGNPFISVAFPEWAAAAHAIVVKDTIHYFWSKRDKNNFWDLRHSFAPVTNPAMISHDRRNPILTPTTNGIDSKSVEYPCPFYNPLTQEFQMYYLVKEKDSTTQTPKQTGFLVSTGDLGVWKRVSNKPVINAEYEYEKLVAGHTSVAISNDTIHIIYTGMTSWQHNPTLCHATALLSNPEIVTKDSNNPVFKGSGEEWDAFGVREAEILKGPVYYHIFYGGRNKDRGYQIGHVRTKDFKTFEPNPFNPIFKVSSDTSAWDSGGLLTPHVFEVGDHYYMIYAGLKGKEWNNEGHCLTGLARAPKK